MRLSIRRYAVVVVCTAALALTAYSIHVCIKYAINRSNYLKKAKILERMEKRSIEYDHMTDAEREQLLQHELSDPFLTDSEWNRSMIKYFTMLKNKY